MADRQAFGGTLIDEPTIRFKLADMATALETSRNTLWRAATALDADHPDKVELCAMAKRYVTDACFDVADQALQLHGGYGYLNEYGLRRSSAICGCTEFSREPTKSCAWSSVGPKPPGPARLLERSAMSTIAFLGLGNMGGPMAANLVAAGHTVRGFDPVPALKKAAEAKGVKVFDTGAEAVADADVVITSLPNGAVVKACYDEVLPAAKAGALFIDTSTISVDDARDIHEQATERGFAQVDAPVSGGVKGAVAGTLAFMVGGEDDAVERPGRCWNRWRARSSTAAVPATARAPSCATTWCSRCSRSRSARPSSSPRSSGCRHSRCST